MLRSCKKARAWPRVPAPDYVGKAGYVRLMLALRRCRGRKKEAAGGKFFTSGEVAQRLGVLKSAAGKWAREHGVAGVAHGKLLYYQWSEADVAAYAADRQRARAEREACAIADEDLPPKLLAIRRAYAHGVPDSAVWELAGKLAKLISG